MNVAIIGGGAAGLMAGGFIAQKGYDVSIFDGNEKCGKKLYITGKGRCNVTNNTDIEGYLQNVVNGKKFMMSSINGFSCQDTINFFEKLGVKLKTERGNRVFPQSDKSSDIIKALTSHAKNCTFLLENKVEKIVKIEDSFLIKSKNGIYKFDKVVIATGGKSYPATGSQGDGYKFAKDFGHTIIKPRPALVPIKIKDEFCSDLEGLSLKNIKLNANYANKSFSQLGELLFTNDAISGPLALSLSSYISNEKEVDLSIDFKPALDEKMLDERILRDISSMPNKSIKYLLKGLLPSRLVDVFSKLLGLPLTQKLNSLTKKQRLDLISLLKNFKLKFNGIYPIESGIVTAGGVDLKEINPKTMESKLVKGLYFIGEVLDVDCLTGGFNIQTAFATAYACSKNI